MSFNRDVGSSLLLLAIGLTSVWLGAQHEMGTPIRMGPGFFPVAVGSLLCLLSLPLAFIGLFQRTPSATEPIKSPDVRGCAAIIIGFASFIAIGRWFGLAPATFVSVLITAAGDRETTVRGALILALILTAVGVIGFAYLLQVQFPILRWPG